MFRTITFSTPGQPLGLDLAPILTPSNRPALGARVVGYVLSPSTSISSAELYGVPVGASIDSIDHKSVKAHPFDEIVALLNERGPCGDCVVSFRISSTPSTPALSSPGKRRPASQLLRTPAAGREMKAAVKAGAHVIADEKAFRRRTSPLFLRPKPKEEAVPAATKEEKEEREELGGNCDDYGREGNGTEDGGEVSKRLKVLLNDDSPPFPHVSSLSAPFSPSTSSANKTSPNSVTKSPSETSPTANSAAAVLRSGECTLNTIFSPSSAFHRPQALSPAAANNSSSDATAYTFPSFSPSPSPSPSPSAAVQSLPPSGRSATRRSLPPSALYSKSPAAIPNTRTSPSSSNPTFSSALQSPVPFSVVFVQPSQIPIAISSAAAQPSPTAAPLSPPQDDDEAFLSPGLYASPHPLKSRVASAKAQQQQQQQQANTSSRTAAAAIARLPPPPPPPLSQLNYGFISKCSDGRTLENIMRYLSSGDCAGQYPALLESATRRYSLVVTGASLPASDSSSPSALNSSGASSSSPQTPASLYYTDEEEVDDQSPNTVRPLTPASSLKTPRPAFPPSRRTTPRSVRFSLLHGLDPGATITPSNKQGVFGLETPRSARSERSVYADAEDGIDELLKSPTYGVDEEEVGEKMNPATLHEGEDEQERKFEAEIEARREADVQADEVASADNDEDFEVYEDEDCVDSPVAAALDFPSNVLQPRDISSLKSSRMSDEEVSKATSEALSCGVPSCDTESEAKENCAPSPPASLPTPAVPTWTASTETNEISSLMSSFGMPNDGRRARSPPPAAEQLGSLSPASTISLLSAVGAPAGGPPPLPTVAEQPGMSPSSTSSLLSAFGMPAASCRAGRDRVALPVPPLFLPAAFVPAAAAATTTTPATVICPPTAAATCDAGAQTADADSLSNGCLACPALMRKLLSTVPRVILDETRHQLTEVQLENAALRALPPSSQSSSASALVSVSQTPRRAELESNVALLRSEVRRLTAARALGEESSCAIIQQLEESLTDLEAEYLNVCRKLCAAEAAAAAARMAFDAAEDRAELGEEALSQVIEKHRSDIERFEGEISVQSDMIGELEAKLGAEEEEKMIATRNLGTEISKLQGHIVLIMSELEKEKELSCSDKEQQREEAVALASQLKQAEDELSKLGVEAVSLKAQVGQLSKETERLRAVEQAMREELELMTKKKDSESAIVLYRTQQQHLQEAEMQIVIKSREVAAAETVAQSFARTLALKEAEITTLQEKQRANTLNFLVAQNMSDEVAKNTVMKRQLDKANRLLEESHVEIDRLKRELEITDNTTSQLLLGSSKELDNNNKTSQLLAEWKRSEFLYQQEIECLNSQLEMQGSRVSMSLYKMALEDAKEQSAALIEREKDAEELYARVRELEMEMMSLKLKAPATPLSKRTPLRQPLQAHSRAIGSTPNLKTHLALFEGGQASVTKRQASNSAAAFSTPSSAQLPSPSPADKEVTPKQQITRSGGRAALAQKLKAQRSTPTPTSVSSVAAPPSSTSGKSVLAEVPAAPPSAPGSTNNSNVRAATSDSALVSKIAAARSPLLNAAFLASKQRKLYRKGAKDESKPVADLGADFGQENLV